MQLNFSLAQLAHCVRGELRGKDVAVKRISTDTRTLQPGDLFVALSGENFNGNTFVSQAKLNGAIAAIVSEDISEDISKDLPIILVKDTTQALGQIAAMHREHFSLPMIGITGSMGKTTTRALLANILNSVAPTLASRGSFNNAVGVPLTLLQLTPQHRYAVLEMGMNHLGEIAYLTQLVRPSIAVITNIGPVHLEFLGSEANVARAKAEIFQGLAEDGISVLPRDDKFYEDLAEQACSSAHSSTILTFGTHPEATVRATQISLDAQACPRFQLHTPAGSVSIQLPLMGEHNVMNALAAAAAAIAAQIPLMHIQQGLQTAQAENKRLNRINLAAQIQIIDDSYNANPASVAAAIKLLQATPATDKILVLGDMAELGTEAVQWHQQCGVLAKQAGLSGLYTCGPYSQHAAQAFGSEAHHFDTQEALIIALSMAMKPNSVILVKGSRSSGMERVVQALQANSQQQERC
jgi:UDP-N-acetylmuramoyl-tripeptide--D-alanyl-D-alanine ligase